MARTKKIWRNHKGEVVPGAYVPPLSKKRERVALKVYKGAIKLNAQLRTFKTESLAICDGLFEQMLADNDLKKDTKGNYSITSFDKSIKIEVNVSERIEFDDQIQIAQEKINQFLALKTKDVDGDLVQIVNLAFKTRKGQMDVKRVLSLFELKITHKKWVEAIELIKASISRNISKRYMRIWEKGDNGQYYAIELNFSSI